MITEFMSYGSLFTIIHVKDIKKESNEIQMNRLLSPSLKLKVLKDISAGMNYLHSQDPIIIHRDLKCKKKKRFKKNSVI